MHVVKYNEFSKTINEFFSKEFPSGIIKLEAKSAAKGILSSSLGKTLGPDTFTDVPI